MRIRVLRVGGQAPRTPLEARFGLRSDAPETIGRAEHCTLVLPDKYNHISRVQAEIVFTGGAFVLTDRGSSVPVLHGGVELGRGRQVKLADGDLLTIGEFELGVEVDALPAGADAAAGPDVSATQFWGTLAAPSAPTDPFGQLVGDTPIADASRAAHAAESARRDAAGGLGPAGGPLIPEDFDPFAPDAPPDDGRHGVLGPDTGRVAAPDSGLGDPLAALQGRRIAPSESIDQLFGLSGAAANPLASDTPIGDPISAPNTAGSVDPLVALGAGPGKPSYESIPDHVPEIRGSYVPPRPLAEPPREEPLRAPARDASQRPTNPAAPVRPISAPPRPTGTMYKSWEDPPSPPGAGSTGRTPPVPNEPAAPRPPPATRVHDRPPPAKAPASEPPLSLELRSAVEGVIDAHRPDFQAFPTTHPTDRLSALNEAAVQAAVAANAQRPAEAGAVRDVELLKAFLLGAGLSELPRSPEPGGASATELTPELMRRIGTILRISTKGMRDLLQARAMLKREMRTRMTMIVPRDNNPIKFSPDVASALNQLLAPRALRGFLEPVPAVQEAYNDLLAHQVGFVAGMRAAIQGLIERFDPAKLEGRLTRKSMVDSLVPMSRRAKLWELYGELYSEIAREAEDDFDALFGRAFVQAYEEQVSRLEKSGEA